MNSLLIGSNVDNIINTVFYSLRERLSELRKLLLCKSTIMFPRTKLNHCKVYIHVAIYVVPMWEYLRSCCDLNIFIIHNSFILEAVLLRFSKVILCRVGFCRRFTNFFRLSDMFQKHEFAYRKQTLPVLIKIRQPSQYIFKQYQYICMSKLLKNKHFFHKLSLNSIRLRHFVYKFL